MQDTTSYTNDPVRMRVFDPIGVNHELQQAITNLLHRLAMNSDPKFTLAQLGYLHMNSVCFVNDEVQAKIYFAPELAIVQTPGFGGRLVNKPSPLFAAFQNWLFVGSVEGAIEYDTATVPKYNIIIDDSRTASIYLAHNKKVFEDHEVVVLRCNPMILMAAICDINPADPSFTVTYETIGKSDKDKDNPTGAQIMISSGVNKEFPVRITVTNSSGNGTTGYDPDMAVPCLLNARQKAKQAIDTRKQLALKASKDAAKAAKKRPAAKQYAEYMKYR